MVPGKPFPASTATAIRRSAPEGRAAGRAARRPAGRPRHRRHLRDDTAAHGADRCAARRPPRHRAARRARPARGPPRRVGGRALPPARRRGPPARRADARRAAVGRDPRRRVAGVAPRRACAGRSTGSSPPIPTSVSSSFCHGGVIAEILAQVADTDRPFAFLGCDNASISQVVASTAAGSCAASTTPPTSTPCATTTTSTPSRTCPSRDAERSFPGRRSDRCWSLARWRSLARIS